MDSASNQRVHLTVCGRVQGVCFRACTQETATRLNLTGWVRNRMDLSVEIVAEGSKENLQKLMEWASTGPTLARVTDVKASWQKATGEFTGFKITP